MMRSVVAAVLCSLLLFTLGACASGPPKDVADIEVQAKTNPKVDLSPYRTYTWAAAAAAVRDPDREWTPTGLDVGSEIMFLVDRELRERGRTSVVDKPDMLAIFAVGVDMKALNVTVDPDTRIVSSETAPRGGISIVLADPETRQAIWIGRAMGDISDNATLELAKRRIEYAITEMFADFPR
jgi:hypothetical protein